MRTSEFIDKSVFALDEEIGKVKSVEVDPEEWKITHLEIELKKEIAESVLGVKKGGVRNMLAVSSLEKGVARWTDNGLHLKVSKDQLHMYLRPVVKTQEKLIMNTILAIVVVLVVLWLVGFFAFPGVGALIHILLVIAVILLLVWLLTGKKLWK